ncbi:MAG TPA: hypothetical protein VNA69_16420 [Thermoanaerobaculia bacterium]|nr:hypothetical protein [Thermoanaerobaculia bacterium]
MVFWFVLLAASGAGAEERKLLVSGIFADSSIVGPFVRFSKTDPASSDYVITLLGRTLDGQWIRHFSPKQAFVASADLTPVNAHFSDRIYVNGERVHDLEYEAASYRLRGGFRLTPNERSTTEIHLVGLIEEVDGLQDGAVTAFWDEPFVGLDVSHAY